MEGAGDGRKVGGIVCKEEPFANAQVGDALGDRIVEQQVQRAGVAAGNKRERHAVAVAQERCNLHQARKVFFAREHTAKAGKIHANAVKLERWAGEHSVRKGINAFLVLEKHAFAQIAHIDHEHHLVALALPGSFFAQKADGIGLALLADLAEADDVLHLRGLCNAQKVTGRGNGQLCKVAHAGIRDERHVRFRDRCCDARIRADAFADEADGNPAGTAGRNHMLRVFLQFIQIGDDPWVHGKPSFCAGNPNRRPGKAAKPDRALRALRQFVRILL